MSKVKRVYVEKKPDYAVKAKELHEEIKNYLGIKAEYVRVLVRYDIENISDETYSKALETVFAEPPVDVIYEGEPRACSYRQGILSRGTSWSVRSEGGFSRAVCKASCRG